MTIVFRSSTFFIVVVISLKMTTFITWDMRLADGGRLTASIDRLIDEGVRYRKEAEDSAEESNGLAVAVRYASNRVIRWMNRCGSILSHREVRQRSWVAVASAEIAHWFTATRSGNLAAPITKQGPQRPDHLLVAAY